MNNFNDFIEEDGNLINSLRESEYFYRVDESVRTLCADSDKEKSFAACKEFKGRNLLKCKSEATDYYFERLKGLNNGTAKFFLPFAGPNNFIEDKNSACSISLSFIEYFSKNDQDYFIIEGETEDILKEGREFERSILIQKGYIKE
jgi:hypothetical protein